MFRVGPTLPYWLRTAIYVHTYISILYCVFYLLFRGGGQKRALWGNKTSFQPKSGSEAPRAARRPEPTGIFPCAYQGEELPEVSAQFDSVKRSPRWHDGDASPPRAEPFRRFGAPSKKTLLTVFAKLGEVTVPCLGATLDRFPGKKTDTILRTVRRLLWQIVHGRTLQRVAMPFQIVRGRPRLAALSARTAPLDVIARHAEYGGDLGRRSCAWSAKTTPPWPVSIDHT